MIQYIPNFTVCVISSDLEADVAFELEVVSVHVEVVHDEGVVHVVWEVGRNGEITETHHLL